MTARRVASALLTAVFAAGLFAVPAQAQTRTTASAPARTAAAQDGDGDGGQWLACHPHSFRDWCPVLGPEWHQLRWQYCDSVWGKQEYCVKTPPPAPAPAAVAPRD
ncbi:hypothetical protein [Streptomyces sp. NPDC056670]|uniref:hypothetical protein n=1 Tax=Streptomyces sp. NPDC056670 TaxID=3345904 RepID=UPI0036860FB5